MQETKHISEVCKLLNTTSRTIRYYEQLGLLRTVREGENGARRLDGENIERLKRIMFLRKIGLSLETILEVFRDGIDVQELLRAKKSEFTEEIKALRNHIRLLETVMKAAENGDNIFALSPEDIFAKEDAENRKLTAHFVQLMLAQRFDELMPLVHPIVRERVTPEMFSASWQEFFKSCGSFVRIVEQRTQDYNVTTIMQFENARAAAIITCKDGFIAGIVYNYFDEKEDNHV